MKVVKCSVCNYPRDKNIEEVGGYIPCEYCFLKEENKRLQNIVNQVDDYLIVNWVVAVNDDYLKALHDLVTHSIAESEFR